MVYQVVDSRNGQAVVEQYPDEAMLRRRAYFHTLDLAKGEPTRILATDRRRKSQTESIVRSLPGSDHVSAEAPVCVSGTGQSRRYNAAGSVVGLSGQARGEIAVDVDQRI